MTTRVERADRRLGLRLTLGLVATFALGVPFLLLAMLVRAEWSPLIRLDNSVAVDLNGVAVRNDWLVDTLKVLSDVFDPMVFRVAITLIALWLLRAGRRRLALWAVVTIWGAALLGWGLKLVVGRARPDLVGEVATAPGRSFPSGHSLGSWVGCGVLLLLAMPLLRGAWRAVAWGLAILVPVVVCFARVGLGVHYLSDVTAGAVLGLGWLVVTSAIFEWWRREVGLPPAPATEAEPELGEGVPEPRTG
ncbi:MAG TPA: phosphatase PAP2 family protein [Mycobacteriales bacterium]|nr:phosphatase PAP2 family protein [Mycobacteriales bacterium]